MREAVECKLSFEDDLKNLLKKLKREYGVITDFREETEGNRRYYEIALPKDFDERFKEAKERAMGPTSTTVRFDVNQKMMYVGNKSVDLSQAPIQRDLVAIILKNPADAHKDWFYAEMDPTSSLLDDKNRIRLKNAAYQLRKKLKTECGIADFFENIDTRSCKISDKYHVLI